MAGSWDWKLRSVDEMIKIGTVGSGMIVNEILDAVSKTEGIVCEAVYSRREETGKALADKFGVKKVYTQLEHMYEDAEVAFVYIASPNSLHYEQAKKALEYGKHVICEKPFTATLSQARELAKLAKSRRLFLIEAITTMYMKNYAFVREQLSRIGTLKMVLCTYCQYSGRYDLLKEGVVTNVFDPQFAGGALMDINLYNIYFVVGLFGKPQKVQYFPTRHENGIDTNGILIMQYPDFVCQCTGAKDTWCDNSVQILGDQGYITVPSASNVCSSVTVTTKEKSESFNFQQEKHWLLEVRAITDLIKRRDYEECCRRLEKSLEVMEVLEAARESGG